MNQRLSIGDVIGLGLMTFAFFLGAGNIIFPTLEGQLAGTNVVSAMLGFLVTAVGLPLLALVAVAYAGGSVPVMAADLPKGTGVFGAVLLFIIIGPAFAAPRTGLVAYEMAIKPLFSLLNSGSVSAVTESTGFDYQQMWMTALFFLVALLFSWTRGKLIDYIGKILTPVLFVLLVCLAVGVVLNPQGEQQLPVVEAYQTMAFSKGFVGGYNTMDTFAALMFGILLIDVLRGKGITERGARARYLIIAGIIAAVGLAFVYISLFFLGATSSGIAANATHGGVILTAYVYALFGEAGQWILSGVVLLACLTTAIGLISACADYFSTLTSLRYRAWVIILALICAVVANVGLSALISLSIPALMALYPLAITLVLLTFLRPRLPDTRIGYRIVMAVALLFSLLDALRAMDLPVAFVQILLAWQSKYMPLAEQGLAWFVPTLVALVLVFFLPKSLPHSGDAEIK